MNSIASDIRCCSGGAPVDVSVTPISYTEAPWPSLKPGCLLDQQFPGPTLYYPVLPMTRVENYGINRTTPEVSSAQHSTRMMLE